MDPNETRILRELRAADLPRAMRGFHEDATRRMLNEAAGALKAAGEARDRLQRQTERARQAPADDDTPDVEAIGRALVVATSMSDQLVASAKERAELLVAEAEAEAERLLGEARAGAAEVEQEVAGQRDRLERDFAALKHAAAQQREQLETERRDAFARIHDEAERMVADASAEVDRLRTEAVELRSFIESKTTAFAGIAQAALRQLEELETARPGAPEPARDPAELLSDLSPVEAAAEEPEPEAELEPESDVADY